MWLGTTKNRTFNAEKPPFGAVFLKKGGPSDRIRTCGILLPKQARYQLRYTRLLSYSIRLVVFSQTRRDTNFAIPGYSLFCHDTTAKGKNKVFSVCGHSCGQSRFCAAFGNRGKSRKRRCHKTLQRFAPPCPGYNHGTPKPGAIPTSLYPDIQLLPLYHGEKENQRYFCLWSILWSKPLLCRFRQSEEIPQRQVSQGFAAFRLALPRIPTRHTQTRRDTSFAIPGYARECG